MFDRIDLERLREVTWLGRVEYFPSVSSTNDVARSLDQRASHEEPVLVVAEGQTAGRGRGSNRWWTGQGSLAFTLSLDPLKRGIAARYQAMIALAAAVSITETVRPLLPGRQVGLHWPNDVFAADRKLAGVLVEALSDGRQLLGIGLNVNNSLREAPADVAERATSLADLAGRVHDRTEVLVSLLAALEPALARLAADPLSLGRRADELCLQHGQALCLRWGGHETRGVCGGIAPDGALVLHTHSGRSLHYAGALGRASGAAGERG